MRRALWPVVVLAAIAGAVLLARRGARAPGERAAAVVVSPTIVVAGRSIAAERVNAFLAARLGFTSRGGEARCAYTLLGQEPASSSAAERSVRGDSVHLYLESMCMELVRDGDSIATGSGRAGPVRIAGVIDGDTVRLVDAAVPPDGGGHAAGVRRLFPDAVARRILEPSAAAQAPRRALEAALRREAHVKAGLPAPAPGLP